VQGIVPPTGDIDIGAGLIQSLLIKDQRRLLDQIGRRVGTKVVYLKAAWADPVLHGGRGERTGSDIDILVAAGAFEAFAGELLDRGFRRYRHPSPAHERYFGHKEWAFFPPAGRLPVDLHREVTEPIWWNLPGEELLARAIAYDSVDGPILSLSPEDQILYTAAHYANHLYDLDGRHLGDCQRLLAAHAIDWALVAARARAAHLRLPLLLVVQALAARGCNVPRRISGALGEESALRAILLETRRRIATRFVVTGPALRRRGPRSRLIDYAVMRPLLSDRLSALPRVVARHGLPWLRERLPHV
jgi:hypothetical protein